MPNNSNNSNNNNSDTQFIFAVCLLAGFFIITAAWRTYLDKVPVGDRPVFKMPSVKIPTITIPVAEAPSAETSPSKTPVAQVPTAERAGARAAQAERVPVAEVSDRQTPEMPSPNAYNFYTEAAETFVRTNYYNKARNEIKITSRMKMPESIAGKEAFLKKNAQALAKLKKGLKDSCLVPDPYFFGGPRPARGGLPESIVAMHFYDLAQLMLAESQVHSSRGNWKQAANTLLDMQKFGHDIMQGATGRNSSHSLGCRASSYRELQKVYPRLNATQAKAVVRRWEEILKKRVRLVDILRKQKQIAHIQLSRQLEYNSGNSSASPIDAARRRVSNFTRQETQPDREAINESDAYADRLITLAQAPFDPQAKQPEKPPFNHKNLMTYIYMSNMNFQEKHWASLQDELRDSLLLTAIAVHAYRLDHKMYPRDLKQLVPTYLKQVPRDVFGDRKPLLYTLTGQTYSLYSVGPDGIDDQGRAIEYRYPHDRLLSDASIYQVSPRSQGDIVMGVNIGRAAS